MTNSRLQKFIFMLCGLLLAAGHVMKLNGAAEPAPDEDEAGEQAVPDEDTKPDSNALTYRNPPFFMPIGRDNTKVLNFGYRGDDRQLAVLVRTDGRDGQIDMVTGACNFEYVVKYDAYGLVAYRVLPQGLFFYLDRAAIPGLDLTGPGLYSPILHTCFNLETNVGLVGNPNERVFGFESIATPFFDGYEQQAIATGTVFSWHLLTRILAEQNALLHPFPVPMFVPVVERGGPDPVLPRHHDVAAAAEETDPFMAADDEVAPRAAHDAGVSPSSAAAAADGAGGGVRDVRSAAEAAEKLSEEEARRVSSALKKVLERPEYQASAPGDDSRWLRGVRESYQRGEERVAFLRKYFTEGKAKGDIPKLLEFLRNEIGQSGLTLKQYWTIEGILNQNGLTFGAGTPVVGRDGGGAPPPPEDPPPPGGRDREDRGLLDRLTGLRGNLERLQAALGQLRDRTGS